MTSVIETRLLRRITKTAIAFISSTIVLLAVALLSGCGSSSADSAQTDSVATNPSPGLSRPAAGTVEMIDGLGDTSAPDGSPIKGPREADIDTASISKQGDNYVFALELAGTVPNTVPSDTGAVEWAFMIDTNGDGQPDWGIFADLTSKGWAPGLYNEQSKQRLTDASFPGTIKHENNTITWTVPASTFGSPASFKWIAYTDDQARPTTTTDKPSEATDRVPDDAWPRGQSWLAYP